MENPEQIARAESMMNEVQENLSATREARVNSMKGADIKNGLLERRPTEKDHDWTIDNIEGELNGHQIKLTRAQNGDHKNFSLIVDGKDQHLEPTEAALAWNKYENWAINPNEEQELINQAQRDIEREGKMFELDKERESRKRLLKEIGL